MNYTKHIINNKHDREKYVFYNDTSVIQDYTCFLQTVDDVMTKLNNGISWDDIDITPYSIIEKYRHTKSSIGEFSKFVFTIKLNNDLEWISKNIQNLKQTYIFRYDYYQYPFPPGVHPYDMQKIYICSTSIQKAPFIKDYLIGEAVPREKESRYCDC